MEDSFSRWRESSSQFDGPSSSFVISDSEEDSEVETSDKGIGRRVYVDESNDEDTDVSRHAMSRRSPLSESTPVASFKEKVKKKNIIIDSDEEGDSRTEHHLPDNSDNTYNIDTSNEEEDDEDYIPDDHDLRSISYSPVQSKNRKRKDISHDYTKEDIKELKHNSSEESLTHLEDKSIAKDDTKQQNIDRKVPNEKKKTDVAEIVISSDSGCEKSSEAELALSLVKEEIGHGSIDPIVAQKRALTVCKLEQLKNQLARTQLLLVKGNIEVLPDKGDKLHKSIRQQEKEIEMLTLELEKIPLVESAAAKETEMTKESFQEKNAPLFVKDDPQPHFDINNMFQPTTLPDLKQLGKKAQATMDKELALTVERLKDLHGSLVARPSENEKAEDPRGLKVNLMPHQQHALAWLLWREHQRPSGGVLADDMGLGKTLTMISLIMSTLADNDSEDDSDDSDSGWADKRKPLHHRGGTLVVCPASLLSQWEGEIRNRCKRGLLSVEIYHGNHRENVPKRLAKNNIVITTYNLLSREHKSNSTLYKIDWKRVILDEAHIIRNHKSQASEAACALRARKRWALTGTPIQNKELDLYSILKFLKCTPFNDLRVWKRWVDNKNAAGHQRLATVMKTLMLRRTKQELMAKGDLENLPDKSIEEVIVKLDRHEQLVYEKILVYSRTLFAQFLAQRAEKEHMFELYGGKYDKPSFLSNPNKKTQFTKAQNKLLAMHADVKTHEILVLLLRLRQVCCHPALIHAMLDQEDVRQSGIMDMENVDPDFLSRVNNMSLNDIDNPEEEAVGIDERITENLLTIDNPVFNTDRTSSKMQVLLDMVKEILQKGNDKLIIISQWTALLEVIGSRLTLIKGATFSKFTGDVAIKDRQGIMDAFNDPRSDPRILLLSLTAGGVGLNLVGANHLLLFDIHWNPQLETQAQDRIYRFGQTKNVYIYKFICSNTIEERIKALQERKIEIAQNVLSGDRINASSKLTLNDLKSLFGL